jgi:hypothetical protein
MKYIELYVKAVGRKLPQSMREDIEAELKSTLMDMLDDRAKADNRIVDEELEQELLKEYGSPDEVAAKYLPEQQLISPKLYPIFWMILKIVLTVLAITTIVSIGVQLGQMGVNVPGAANVVGEAFLGLIQSAMQAFGTLVLVFALITRFGKIDADLQTEWQPRDLLKIRDEDKIKPAELITVIIFSTIGIVIFNFYPDLISLYNNVNGQIEVYPLLTAAFFGYLLWFNILWILEIIQNALLLKDGVYTRASRIFEIGLNIANVVLLIVIISGPSIVQLPVTWMQDFAGMSSETAVLVRTQFVTGIRTVLGLVSAIVIIETAVKAYKLFRK